jgi:hypothetical protein
VSPRVALAAVMLVWLAGCTKDPGTSVEQVFGERSQPKRRRYQNVFPPKCAEIPTAEYPDIPPDQRPELVSVRVDLTIDPRGDAGDLTGEVIEGSVFTDLFVGSALRAAAHLHCQPAVRPPRPGSGETAPQPVAYRSALIYRFHRYQMQARGSF